MRIIAALLMVLLFGACSQAPFQRLNPTGDWSGTWTGAGLVDTSLHVAIVTTSGGWQAVFTSNNSPVTAMCSNPEKQGPNYLYCGAWSGTEVLVWEGNVSGNAWSGTWTYVSSSRNLGGSFVLHRTQ